MDFLIELDKALLVFLNSYNSSYWDYFFWIYTSTIIWTPLYITLGYIIFKNQGLKGFITLISIAVLIMLCDRIASGFFKNYFERLRPSHNPLLENTIHLINGKKGGMFGFISSHAANTFGLATFTALLFRNKIFTTSIFVWAILNCYSRIYMGVHYPADILGGMTLGLTVGYGIYVLYVKKLSPLIGINTTHSKETKTAIANVFSKDTALATYAIVIMISTLLLASKELTKLI